MPAGTKKLCFGLKFMHACMLTKVVVKQAAGDAMGFTINIYNRQTCDVLSGSSSSSQPAADVAPELAKVIPTQRQNVPGSAMELFHPDGYSFRNMEGSLSVPVRVIYLEIEVDDPTNESQWEVALGCRPRY
jgi:hypothetical protein